MRFHLVAALAAHFAHQRVQDPEQVEIIALLRHRPGDAPASLATPVSTTVFQGLAMIKVPSAMPAMITNSHGCQITLRCPPRAMKPPTRLASVTMNQREYSSTAPEKGYYSFRHRCLHEADIRSPGQPRASLGADFRSWLRYGSTIATPSISVDQPIELGINAATLTSLQNLKIGR